MDGKPGFMMYHSRLRALAKMNPESFKAVMMALCDYSEFGTEPTGLNDIETMAYDMAREALDRDTKKYQSRVEAGRKGGIASGEARRSKTKQNEANEPTQRNPNVTPTVTATPTVTVTPTITTGNSSNSYAREEEEIPPSVGEVEEYIREHGLGVDAQDFMERCEAAGWKDGKGEPVTNWRMWLKGYAIRAARPEDGRAGRLGMDPRLAALEAMKGGRG